MPWLKCQLRQVHERRYSPQHRQHLALGQKPHNRANQGSAGEPDANRDKARRVMRHGNPDHCVQDLLPEVIGRSVLRVNLVVDGKTFQELLNGHQEVSFVVVLLKLREYEAMANPGERTQKDCGKQPHSGAVRSRLRVCGDMCHPATALPALLRVSALCRNGNTRPKTCNTHLQVTHARAHGARQIARPGTDL